MFDLDLYFQGQIVLKKIEVSIFFSINVFEPCYIDVANVMLISNWDKEHTIEKKISPAFKGWP